MRKGTKKVETIATIGCISRVKQILFAKKLQYHRMFPKFAWRLLIVSP